MPPNAGAWALVDSKARMRCTKFSSRSAIVLRSSPNAFECSSFIDDGGSGGDGLDGGYDVREDRNLVGDGETVRDLRFRTTGRGIKLNAAEVDGNGRDERAPAVRSDEGWEGALSISPG